MSGALTARNSTVSADVEVGHTDHILYISVILLMTGIVAARFGLWVADLSVNQILQGVEDGVRGTVNGVQSSMNMIFDTCKFVLVIIFPLPQMFGFLVCISFMGIVFGWISYASYALQQHQLTPLRKSTTSFASPDYDEVALDDGIHKENPNKIDQAELDTVESLT